MDAAPAGQCWAQSRGDGESGQKGHMEKATHVAPEAQPDLPSCPLAFVSCPLPVTTLTFIQFLKYRELIPASGRLHLLFSLGGSSSSFQALRSQHKCQLLLGTSHSTMSPCPSLPPPVSHCPVSLASQHTLLSDICCFTSLSNWSVSAKRPRPSCSLPYPQHQGQCLHTLSG